MPASIPLTGLAANDPVPGNYLEINFAQGAASLGTATYPILLVANKTTAGDATVDTVVYGPNASSPLPFVSTQDAINRFGQGSEMHRGFRRVVGINTVTPVFGIAVSESSGAKASFTINFLSGAAGANGTARVFMGDDSIDTGITLGDSAAVVVTNVVNSVNSKLDWAVTAAANAANLSGTISVTNGSAAVTFSTSQTLAAGTALVFASQSSVVYYLTGAVSGTSGTLSTNYTGTTNASTTSVVQGVILTAKQKGLRGNWLRASCVVVGAGVVMTSSAAAQAFFTGGTTSDSSATALATILPFRYYYIVSAAEGDATNDPASQLGALVSQVNTQAQPITGIRQRVVAGSCDPSSVAAAAITVCTGLNAARAEVVWQMSSDWTPFELACNAAAIYALEEIPTAFRCNFSGYGADANTQPFWKVPAAKSGTAPTRSVIKAALNNGLTPIATNQNGSTYLVKRITTRSLQGSNNDYRIRDSHKVTVCDRFGDDWLNKCGLEFSGKKLANDPLPGQRVPGPDVTTPRVIKASLWKLEADYADLDLIQNLDQVQANTQVIREVSPTTRASCKIPLQTCDILDQIASSLDQVA